MRLPFEAAAVTELEPFRLSVTQYHAIRDAGILGEDDRVELLDGILVAKTTKTPPHRLATRLVRVALERLLPEGYYVDSQEPITTADSEPEPDVAIVRGARRDFSDRHPGPEHVGLVVEVADESLPRDRGTKSAVYARAGIASYWILNLRARVVEVYASPRAGAYATRRDYPAGTEIPVDLDAGEIGRVSVDELLP